MTAKTRAIPSLHRDSFAAKVPGLCPVLASGNTTSPYYRAVSNYFMTTLTESIQMTRLFPIIILTILSSCNSRNEIDSNLFKYKNDSKISNKFGEPIDSNTFYIPINIFYDSLQHDRWETYLDSFHVKYFSQVLHKTAEPILTNNYLGKEIYRLTLLRSFDPDLVIRIEKSNDGIILVEKTHFQFKSSVEDSVYQDGDMPIHCIHVVIDSIRVTKSSKKLSTEIWNRFENVVRNNKFHLMPTKVKMDFGPDGDIWLLEKHSRFGYYFVKRSSFGKGVDSLRTICDSLIRIRDIKINEE